MNIPQEPSAHSPGGERSGERVHLERALSKLGLLSRGLAANAIRGGEVTVNGARELDPRRWVNWRQDVIHWQGAAALKAETHRYGVLHKPKGLLTTRDDEMGREATVYSCLPEEARQGWLFPVGRLDKDSEGLLLFTNDGPWSSRMSGPESKVSKTYRVKLDRQPRPEDLQSFRQGLEIQGEITLPCEAEAEGGPWVRVVLHEGRNRQIRRMFHTLDYNVKRLIRIAIGPIVLDPESAVGSFRWLLPEEVRALNEV